jgi:hypothetical protein
MKAIKIENLFHDQCNLSEVKMPSVQYFSSITSKNISFGFFAFLSTFYLKKRENWKTFIVKNSKHFKDLIAILFFDKWIVSIIIFRNFQVESISLTQDQMPKHIYRDKTMENYTISNDLTILLTSFFKDFIKLKSIIIQ